MTRLGLKCATIAPVFIFKLSICALLVLLSVSNAALIQASKLGEETFPYHTVLVPFLAELVKLMISYVLLITQREQTQQFIPSSGVLLYAVPALCYFVANNSSFIIISNLGMTSFQILGNLKILTTAMLSRVILQRTISRNQMRSLCVLTLGAIVSELSPLCGVATARPTSLGFIAVLVSNFASSFASVYTEKLIKRASLREGTINSLNLENTRLYVFGVFFNAIPILRDAKLSSAANIFVGFNIYAALAVFTSSCGGLVVSLILKYLDSVAKCIVAAVTMIIMGLTQSILTHQPIPSTVICGIVLITISIEQYSTLTR